MSYERGLIEFTQELVKFKSTSGNEEHIVKCVAEKMKALDYDEVIIDGFGNVVGRVGDGARSIMFDSHVDTVEVMDEADWTHPPFSGEIVGEWLWGRGSVDMKSGAAASIYAAAEAKKLGLLDGKRVYVSCTVFEEDCDGMNLKYMFDSLDFRPDLFVTCEPSNNIITLGHKGKAQIIIHTQGVSAHGSAPEKGINAIYEMADIIKRVEAKNEGFMRRELPRPTLVMSKISSVSASLNAVPSDCEVYLDRRMVVGETEMDIRREMDELIEGKRATWRIGTLNRTTWTGLEVSYDPLHIAWEISKEHPLTEAFNNAYEVVYGNKPERYDFWDFSTNAVTTVALGIPTIGFGPGEYKLAHMVDERCHVEQIVKASEVYLNVIKQFR